MTNWEALEQEITQETDFGQFSIVGDEDKYQQVLGYLTNTELVRSFARIEINGNGNEEEHSYTLELRPETPDQPGTKVITPNLQLLPHALNGHAIAQIRGLNPSSIEVYGRPDQPTVLLIDDEGEVFGNYVLPRTGVQYIGDGIRITGSELKSYRFQTPDDLTNLGVPDNSEAVHISGNSHDLNIGVYYLDPTTENWQMVEY